MKKKLGRYKPGLAATSNATTPAINIVKKAVLKGAGGAERIMLRR